MRYLLDTTSGTTDIVWRRGCPLSTQGWGSFEGNVSDTGVHKQSQHPLELGPLNEQSDD
jgi:hypothetical protein